MIALDQFLAQRLVVWIPLILSLTVHEWAHAASARLLGDDTAQRLGRLTLNPVEHIDPIGTLLLPLLGVPFGWAKPVPINPLRFRADVGMRTGLWITAAAGPASNLSLALVGAAIVMLVNQLSPASLSPRVLAFGETFVVLNVLLAFFNLLPIPPLDGSRIVDAFVPDSLRGAWDVLGQYSGAALVAVIFLPVLAGFDLFSWPYEWAQKLLNAAERM